MKKWKWQIIMAITLAAVFTANHVEHYFRSQRIRRQAMDRHLPVVQSMSNVAGHSSIQIDERSLANRGYLYFNTLESWDFSKTVSTPCPQSIMEANGQRIKLMGFMYPLQEARELTTFCLLRSTQTCCYGPRPQFNQYVFVEMHHPVKFERLAPVVVEGRFIVDPKPDEGYIYRMEGESVRSAIPDDQPISASEFAKQNNLPIFDFAPLEAAKASSDKEANILSLAKSLDGKQIIISGFIVGKTQDSPPKLMIGKYSWDGKAKGTPPNLYNTVLVSPQSPADIPPVWWQETVFKGTMHVTQDASRRSVDGIVSLLDSTLAIAGSSGQGLLVDTGPLLPIAYEFIFAAAFAALLILELLRRKRSGNITTVLSGEKK